MLMGNVYRQIVQSTQNLTKRSTCTYKDVILILNQNLENRSRLQDLEEIRSQ